MLCDWGEMSSMSRSLVTSVCVALPPVELSLLALVVPVAWRLGAPGAGWDHAFVSCSVSTCGRSGMSQLKGSFESGRAHDQPYCDSVFF